MPPNRSGQLGSQSARPRKLALRPTSVAGLTEPPRSHISERYPRQRRPSQHAPATSETLQALRDPARRPSAAQVRLDPSLDSRSLPPAQVCKERLLANVRKARRGATAGPSGCTNEHLRVLMDEEATVVLLGHAADSLAGAKVPEDVADALRLGRMVALTKPAGGVRGLTLGDVFRRLVARTLAQKTHERPRLFSLLVLKVQADMVIRVLLALLRERDRARRKNEMA